MVRRGFFQRIQKRQGGQDVRPFVGGRVLRCLRSLRGRRDFGRRRREVGCATPETRMAFGSFERRLFGLDPFLLGGLFGLDALFLTTSLFLCRRLGRQCGTVARLFRLAFRVNGGFVCGRAEGAGRRFSGDGPAAESRESVGEIAGSDGANQRDGHQDEHDDGGSEVGQERREETRHQKVSDPPASILDVESGDQVGDGAVVVPEDLKEAGGRQDESENPETPSSGTKETTLKQEERRDDADGRDDPDGETERPVAVVGEAISQRSDPVGRRLWRHVERRDASPVVGEKRNQGEERQRKGCPGEDAATRV